MEDELQKKVETFVQSHNNQKRMRTPYEETMIQFMAIHYMQSILQARREYTPYHNQKFIG